MSSPRLTVKSIADILRKPGSDPSTTLHDQKYPAAEPQKFRTPYYQSVIAGLRRYYGNSNSRTLPFALRNKLLTIANQARRDNNLRALDSFLASAHSKRRLVPISNRRYRATIDNVIISLSADMQATESGELRIVYFNCRATPVDQETATLIAELAHWVLEANAITVSPNQVEVMDLSNGRTLRAPAWRGSTVAALAGRAKTIAALWDQL